MFMKRRGRFLAELERLERELRARPPHPLVGPPSLHAAMIHGGDGLSTFGLPDPPVPLNGTSWSICDQGVTPASSY